MSLLAREGEKELQAALQKVQADMESQGCSREEIGSQLASVRESHAAYMRQQRQMLQEREEVYKEAIAEGLTPEAAKARVQACAQWQQQMQRLQAKHQAAMQKTHHEAEAAGVSPAEIKRRLEAQRRLQQAEAEAWQQKMRARQQAASEAAEKGQSAAEVEKAVKAVTRAQDAAWAEREAALLAAEGVARREAAEAARQLADASLSPEIRRILLARVRIGGLSARPDLNGREGVAKMWVVEKSRFAVLVDGQGAKAAEQLLLKAATRRSGVRILVSQLALERRRRLCTMPSSRPDVCVSARRRQT